ncbi:MAG: flippase-like domain-containing protein [Chloroflexi bacterium]|nr:flippase-like domain-containing protein [Chloroflexota bacterium]
MLKQKRFWLGALISLALLVFIFYQTDPLQVWDALKQAQYIFLLPALAFYFAGVAIRAARWHFLLRSIKPIPTRELFRTVVIGYMANDLLPARMGELVRAYVLGQTEKVSRAATLVTIVVERVFDGLTMLTFIVAASFLLHFGDETLNLRIRLVAALFIAAIIAMTILAGMPRRVEKFAGLFLRYLPETPRARAERLTRSFLSGLGALRSPVDSLAVFALSLLAWLCETSMYAVIALGFNIALAFPVFLLAAAFANLVTIAPSTPGYVGVFDAPIVYTLVAFGINQNLATSYTLVLHAALFGPVTVLGFFYAGKIGLSLTQMARAENETAPARTRDAEKMV